MISIRDRIDLLGDRQTVLDARGVERSRSNNLYTEQDMMAVIARIANGETLLRICAEPTSPSREVFRHWMKEVPALQQFYEDAKIYRTEHLADEIIDIADDTTFDTKENKEGVESANSEWITRSALRVKTRQWLLERTNSKMYGNKTSTEVSGPEGTPLIPEQTDTEIARRVAFILQTGLNNSVFKEK